MQTTEFSWRNGICACFKIKTWRGFNSHHRLKTFCSSCEQVVHLIYIVGLIGIIREGWRPPCEVGKPGVHCLYTYYKIMYIRPTLTLL